MAMEIEDESGDMALYIIKLDSGRIYINCDDVETEHEIDKTITIYDFLQQIGITEADCIKAFQEKV